MQLKVGDKVEVIEDGSFYLKGHKGVVSEIRSTKMVLLDGSFDPILIKRLQLSKQLI